MITNLLMASGVTVDGEYSASITPPVLNRVTNNGNFTTPFFEALEQNGTGPFEYEWSFTGGDGGNVTINSGTEKRTNLNVSSANRDIEITLTCKVKDTGNSDVIAEASSNILIIFGNNL